MRQVCLLVHGIECLPQERLWNEEVAVVKQRLTSIRLIPIKYGYVSGKAVWFSAWARRQVVDNLEAYLRGVPGERPGLLEDLEPGTTVHYVGHSLGGYAGTALSKRGLKFGCIAHLWGATVADFNWFGVEENFKRARVYYSPDDEILTASSVAVGEDPELALGLMGKIGPTVAHPHVEAIQNPFGFKRHTSFMDRTAQRDLFWADMFKWMEGA